MSRLDPQLVTPLRFLIQRDRFQYHVVSVASIGQGEADPLVDAVAQPGIDIVVAAYRSTVDCDDAVAGLDSIACLGQRSLDKYGGKPDADMRIVITRVVGASVIQYGAEGAGRLLRLSLVPGIGVRDVQFADEFVQQFGEVGVVANARELAAVVFVHAVPVGLGKHGRVIDSIPRRQPDVVKHGASLGIGVHRGGKIDFHGFGLRCFSFQRNLRKVAVGQHDQRLVVAGDVQRGLLGVQGRELRGFLLAEVVRPDVVAALEGADVVELRCVARQSEVREVGGVYGEPGLSFMGPFGLEHHGARRLAGWFPLLVVSGLRIRFLVQG